MAHWNTSVQTFFLPHDKLDNCCFFSANLVCDENNSTFSSVILPTDRCISDRFLLIRNLIQMK